jgi:hypothetical protein
MGSLWIFFFIVTWLAPSGLPFFFFFFIQFGLSWVMPRCVVNLFACWWTIEYAKCCCVEDGAYVPFRVFMEENE